MIRRDKVISIRVDSNLFNKFISIVDSMTESFSGRGGRNWYFYRDETGICYDKFTPADLFEQAMKAYIKKYENQP